MILLSSSSISQQIRYHSWLPGGSVSFDRSVLHLNATSFSVSVQVFHDIAYKAKDRQDLLAGIDEFLDEVIVLPPGEWDPTIRIEPPKSLPSSDKRSIKVCKNITKNKNYQL